MPSFRRVCAGVLAAGAVLVAPGVAQAAAPFKADITFGDAVVDSHLHGRVYLDRMRDFSTLTHLAEWNRYWLGNQEQDD